MLLSPTLTPVAHPVADAPGVEYDPARQGRLISASRPVTGISPARFLAQGREQGRELARFYWRDGRGGVTFAGIGIALSLMGWGEGRFRQVERQARALFEQALRVPEGDALTASRLFGGFAFREDFVPDQTWSAFHPAHFVLPHFQLVQRAGEDDRAWLTINALLPPGEEPSALRAKLHEALTAQAAILSQPLPAPSPAEADAPPEIRYPLSQAEWAGLIERALADFRQTRLEKVVLARVCEVRRPQPLDVDAALAYLERTYPDCFTFLFEPRPHHAFFGATPELLAEVHGSELTSMGLAGSAPRGQTPAEDARHAGDLLASAKDRHEHELVVQALRRRLAPLAASLDVPAVPQIMTLSNIHHLYTPVRATLIRPDGILPLVERLHPTPALGGAPRSEALAFIQAHEGIPRGWYAAPLGWIDQRMDGAFTVAIRSAVVQRNRAWLYAGAGIVPASDPTREWEETGWKFRPVLSALGGIGD